MTRKKSKIGETKYEKAISCKPWRCKRERERERELYFTEINSSLINIVNNIKKDSNKSL